MMRNRVFAAIAGVALFIIALAVAIPAQAAELVMFERAGCPYCEAFDREIAPIYPRTPVGRWAPLRRIDIYRPIPADLQFLRVERITPVFVLIDQGHEVGRIRGYPGDANFWGLLEALVRGLNRRSNSEHAMYYAVSIGAE
jgi:thioredoxin-related protein